MLEPHAVGLAAEATAPIEDYPARIAAIREEMRFEIGVFHERVNALISAEAFLLISFTMALTYAGHAAATSLFGSAPFLLRSGSP